MNVFEIIFGVLLILVSIGILVFVLLQQSRQAGLSGAIAGGSSGDTFFGKNKGRTKEAKLARWTKMLGAAFFVIIFAVGLLIAYLK